MSYESLRGHTRIRNMLSILQIITNDVLTIPPGAERIDLNIVPFDVAETLRSAANMFKAEIFSKVRFLDFFLR